MQPANQGNILISRGLLNPGDQLIAFEHAGVHCYVTKSAKFRLDLLQFADHEIDDFVLITEGAARYIHWGSIEGGLEAPTFRIGDFWTYEDKYTGKTERLNRLYSLAASSWQEHPTNCEQCKEMCWWSSTHEHSDVNVLEKDDRTTWVVPKRHFADFENMPKRDLGSLTREAGKIASRALKSGFSCSIARVISAEGHAFIEVSH